jgi:hypothetical protein
VKPEPRAEKCKNRAGEGGTKALGQRQNVKYGKLRNHCGGKEAGAKGHAIGLVLRSKESIRSSYKSCIITFTKENTF